MPTRSLHDQNACPRQMGGAGGRQSVGGPVQCVATSPTEQPCQRRDALINKGNYVCPEVCDKGMRPSGDQPAAGRTSAVQRE